MRYHGEPSQSSTGARDLSTCLLGVGLLLVATTGFALDESLLLDFTRITASMDTGRWGVLDSETGYDDEWRPSAAIRAEAHTVPLAVREYADRSVMRLVGTLDGGARFGRVLPPQNAAQPGAGLIHDVGPLAEVGVVAANLGDPVWLTVTLEDDAGNRVSLELPIDGVLTEDPFRPGQPLDMHPAGYYTFTQWLHSFPAYQILARVQQSPIPSLRIVGLAVESVQHREAEAEHWRVARYLTRSQREIWATEHPPILESANIDLLIAKIVVVHGSR